MLRRYALYAWIVLWALLSGLVLYPISISLIRALIVVCVVALAILPILLAWPSRHWRYAAFLPLLAVALIAAWPAGSGPRAASYARALRAYLGVRYLWGGENGFGIDCSGLLRRAYIRAAILEGIRGCDPGEIHSGLAVWWHDCSARELRDGYGGRTSMTGVSGRIDAFADADLSVGDLAITADGRHCLAYLGDREWIEADPDVSHVVICRPPDATVRWLSVPVTMVRWTGLIPAK